MILAEYVLGVFGCLGVGLLILWRGGALDVPLAQWTGGLLLGAWLTAIGVDYVPLLAYAVAIYTGRSVRAEADPELARGGRHVRRYTVQQLLLLVPLAIPALALYQEWRRSRRAAAG